MHRSLALFLLIFSLIGQLPAEPIQMSGPIEGFTFDVPGRGFRSILGFPGSASMGDIVLGNFEYGSVAPQKDFGLAFKDGQSSVITGLSAGTPSVTALSGVATPEGIVWSGDGSLAVLYSISGNWIQLLSALPDAGRLGSPIDLSVLSGSLSAIAADRSGKRIAIGVAGESGGVYLMVDGGAPVLVLSNLKPTALAFSDDGSELYSVDAATLQVTTSQLANFTSQSFPLDGLADPIAVKSKRDAAGRQVLLVAGRNDRLLRLYDSSSHEVLTDIPLDFQPSELLEFGRNTLLLNSRASGSEPLWIFTAAPVQDVYFVPATPAVSGGSQ